MRVAAIAVVAVVLVMPVVALLWLAEAYELTREAEEASWD